MSIAFDNTCIIGVSSKHTNSYYIHTTAGQEDPFELDSNLLLSSGRHGEDRKRQYTTTMKHRYLAIWLTYCISIALRTVLVKHVHLSLCVHIYFMRI